MTRLIDADALKEELNKKRVVGRFNTLLLIDNAPTVDPYFSLSEEVFNYITDAEFEHSDGFYIVTPSGKKIEFEKKRPRGEWIISQTMDCHSDIVNVYTCPFCGKRYYAAYPFCHCGADMRSANNG